MSYPGGHDNGYWPGHDQPVGYGMQNQHPQLMANGSPQPAPYFVPGQPLPGQPQVVQQWNDGGRNHQIHYGSPNGYSPNQGYPPMSPAQLQYQPQYAPAPQQAMQQRNLQQQQQYKRPLQNSPYTEQQHKRPHQTSHVDPSHQRIHQTSHADPSHQRTTQISYLEQSHHRPQQISHTAPPRQNTPQNSYADPSQRRTPQIAQSELPRQPTPQSSYSEQPHHRQQQISHTEPPRQPTPQSSYSEQPRHRPYQPSHPEPPRQQTPQSPFPEQSQQRPRQTSHTDPLHHKPDQNLHSAPAKRKSQTSFSEQPPQRNPKVAEQVHKPAYQSPSYVEQPPKISNETLYNEQLQKPLYQTPSYTDQAHNPVNETPYIEQTVEPVNILSHAEYTTISPANLMSQTIEPPTIKPTTLLASYTDQSTISPSNLFSRPVEHSTISPSNLLSRPVEQSSIIPPSLLTQATAAPVQRDMVEIDQSMLLISLAEEYFDAAHSLAPSVALLMDGPSIEKYNKLIATGLGCLEAALKKVKLSPRTEANVTLRFAGVLFDEDTDNFMDAELILSKGIASCERNHYYDLKYAMQFLLAQFMFKKNPKAAMKALDGYIADAQAYRHYSWIYALRFLRVSHAMKSGVPAESHAALQNLKGITNVANEQEDRAIFQMASLMEAIAHLKSAGPESIENVQRAIAAASSHQLNEDSRIPQLVGLTHILDVVCSIRRGNPAEMHNKLQAMQTMMDNALRESRWSKSSDTIAIPINRPRKESHTVSHDTRAVLGIGADGRDNLNFSFLNMKDAYSITYLLSGMILLHDLGDRKGPMTQKTSSERKGFQYLREGLSKLTADTKSIRNPSGLLPNLIDKLSWRGQLLCYFHIYMAFGMAAISDWPGVKKSLDEAKLTAKNMEISSAGPLGYLIPYLQGVLYQGCGNFDAALKIFQSNKFDLSITMASNPSSKDQLEHDIAILAALNALLILQDAHLQDSTKNAALIQRLEPLCTKHANKDIQTAFNLVAATVKTNPPTPGFQTKNHLQAALSGAQRTANRQFICITLNLMCSSFFQNIVGEQAEKSAKAAVKHARESGSVLWISVADGLIAHCYEIQGKQREAQAAFEEGKIAAQRAVPEFLD